jgi:predicted flavoprotein YhiN
MLATGGLSFPQTGSTGDGYEFAKKFGHKIVEPKPGLVGYDLDVMKLKNKVGFEAKKVVAKVICNGKSVFETFGVYKVEQWGVAGTAINNTTRYISHNSLKKYKIQVVSDGKLIDQFTPNSIRPLKEAQVTVGGVDLEDVNPITMESKLKKGLFFGGEVLNIDGPTGGYNLHFAFASARQVVKEVAKRFSYKFDDKLTCVVEKKNNRRNRGEGRANTYKRNRKQRARN